MNEGPEGAGQEFNIKEVKLVTKLDVISSQANNMTPQRAKGNHPPGGEL
jgi:hypothetical protein